MNEVWLYTLASVLLVSIVSFIGVVALSFKTKQLRTILIYFISFSAGALLGDAFLHLLPEVTIGNGLTLDISLYLLGGMLAFFVLEKVIHWQHCHMPIDEHEHIHPFAYTNLIGDGLHNFIDGLIIGASYLVNIPTGIATTIAVVLHEIPQEIGDFGVLIHGGFSKGKALFLNFVSALAAFLGAALALWLQSSVENVSMILVPIAAGGFIYIASSDLIPELHKHSDKLGRSFLQLLAFILGIGVMIALLFLE